MAHNLTMQLSKLTAGDVCRKLPGLDMPGREGSFPSVVGTVQVEDSQAEPNMNAKLKITSSFWNKGKMEAILEKNLCCVDPVITVGRHDEPGGILGKKAILIISGPEGAVQVFLRTLMSQLGSVGRSFVH